MFMEKEIISIGGITFTLKIHYEQRRNCRVSVRKNTINVRIPRFLSQKERMSQLEKMKKVSRDIIEKDPVRFRPPLRKEYTDGDELIINGKTYSINIIYKDKKHSSARLHGKSISLCIARSLSREEQNEHVSTLLSRCIGSERLPSLQKKIHELNDIYFNKKVGNISFKFNTSNWGSCSRAGNINISTRLLFAPDDVLEYVCIHELAHLIELNHSDRFWQLVQQAMPDYKKKIQWLNENAEHCTF